LAPRLAPSWERRPDAETRNPRSAWRTVPYAAAQGQGASRCSRIRDYLGAFGTDRDTVVSVYRGLVLAPWSSPSIHPLGALHAVAVT